MGKSGKITYLPFFFLVQSSSCVSPDYMSQQFDINDRMRGILIDWLIEVNEALHYMAWN